MSQIFIVYIIIAVATSVAIYHAVKMMMPKKVKDYNKCYGCKGCDAPHTAAAHKIKHNCH